MKKWKCKICGYIYEGEQPPKKCPQCGRPEDDFVLIEDDGAAPAETAAPKADKTVYASEHVIGIAKDVDEDIKDHLRADFTGECTEVGMYLAMARQADREGYPEIAEAFKRYAFEEADHASRYAELLGEVVFADTKKNLSLRAAAEEGACAGKTELAKKAKALNLDAIHDTVHEMARDEARHGCGFKGLLERYFGK